KDTNEEKPQPTPQLSGSLSVDASSLSTMNSSDILKTNDFTTKDPIVEILINASPQPSLLGSLFVRTLANSVLLSGTQNMELDTVDDPRVELLFALQAKEAL